MENARTHRPLFLSNTTAKRRGSAKILLCQFREIAQLHDVDIIGGDFRPSAHRERAKAKLSSIEEAREETLRIPPPDLAPRLGQFGDSKRLAWIHRKKNRHNWRAVRHGSLQLDKEKMHHMVTDEGAHQPIFVHHRRNSHSGTECTQ